MISLKIISALGWIALVFASPAMAGTCQTIELGGGSTSKGDCQYGDGGSGDPNGKGEDRSCDITVYSSDSGSDSGSGTESGSGSGTSGGGEERKDWNTWKESCSLALADLREQGGAEWVKNRDGANEWLVEREHAARSWFGDRWSDLNSSIEVAGEQIADAFGFGGGDQKSKADQEAELMDQMRSVREQLDHEIEYQVAGILELEPYMAGYRFDDREARSGFESSGKAFRADLQSASGPLGSGEGSGEGSGPGEGDRTDAEAAENGRFKTPKHTRAGRNLSEAWRYHEHAQKQIEGQALGGSEQENKEKLLEASEGFLRGADESYLEGDYPFGDRQVELARYAIDAAVGFIPGLSAASDIFSIVTGENFFTGESLSNTERALVLATLFVPAAISGTGKALTKFANYMSKYAKNSRVAEDLYKTIRNSDEIFSFGKQLPCGSAYLDSEKSVLDGLRWLRNFVEPSAFASNPCIPVGKTTGDLIDSTKPLGWKASNEAFEDLGQAVNSLGKDGKLSNQFITKDQARSLGWSPGKDLSKYAPGKSIGGDVYLNTNGKLPRAPNRSYYEADIGYRSGKRGAERMVYSNDGKVFVTNDHYETFVEIK